MTDPIVQSVREARAEIAQEFGYDRAAFWAWATGQQDAERQAGHRLPAGPAKTRETSTTTAKSPVTRKRRNRSSSASAV